MSNHFLCSSPLSMAISNSLCFLWVCLFWTFHTSAFCDWLLSLSIMSKVCLFGNIYQYFICFYCWVTFHCMDIPHFIHSFISHWIHYSVFGLFPLFQGLSWWLRGKESTCQCRRCGFDPQVGKIPWRRKWQPSIPAWKIPWTEEPGRLQSWGFQRVGSSRTCMDFSRYSPHEKCYSENFCKVFL